MSNEWEIVYKKAVMDDGSLFFPERLSHEFLDRAKRTMGSYLFANQYQNEIIPSEAQVFKDHWLRYYTVVPPDCYTFAFIDPALSTEDTADYTAVTVIDVDENKHWYVRLAQRQRITPTELVELVFKIHKEFKPKIIGIEDVAYQKALLYMIDETMRKRNTLLPIKGINPGNDRTKEMRILGLVPRFEWGRISVAQGMYDFETEYSQFPRSSHDDILDSLSAQENIVYYPQPRKFNEENIGPQHPNYERKLIRELVKRANSEREDY